MSQFALLMVTSHETIYDACKGWVPALDSPVRKKAVNPFTGEEMDVTITVPDDLAEHDTRPLDDVVASLRDAKPISIDFKYHSSDSLNNAVPILYGNDEFPVPMQKIPDELLERIVEEFSDFLGEYADAKRLRDEQLSVYLLVYDF